MAMNPVGPNLAQETAYWQSQIDLLSRTRLATARDSAGKWSAFITVLLGIFSVVSFTGAITTIDKLADKDARIVKGLVVTALILLAISTALLAYASGNLLPKTLSSASPMDLRDDMAVAARHSTTALKVGRVLGLLAAAAIVGGSVFVFIQGPHPAAKTPPTVVATVNGAAVCGALSKSGGKLAVGGTKLDAAVTSIVIVDACP